MSVSIADIKCAVNCGIESDRDDKLCANARIKVQRFAQSTRHSLSTPVNSSIRLLAGAIFATQGGESESIHSVATHSTRSGLWNRRERERICTHCQPSYHMYYDISAKWCAQLFDLWIVRRCCVVSAHRIWQTGEADLRPHIRRSRIRLTASAFCINYVCIVNSMILCFGSGLWCVRCARQHTEQHWTIYFAFHFINCVGASSFFIFSPDTYMVWCDARSSLNASRKMCSTWHGTRAKLVHDFRGIDDAAIPVQFIYDGLADSPFQRKTQSKTVHIQRCCINAHSKFINSVIILFLFYIVHGTMKNVAERVRECTTWPELYAIFSQHMYAMS